ncbi:M12 family metallo-peptidase [Micromonospora sp. WMMD1102]|uniref:M12 family metallo-peptidase n=1 Tax=Micromonospora sp. WMMD1102 TaxID=3016105 RepID=UPI002415331E|nr:M12 family metallo-peptidase [Micromonospora sp. WMMD1102]MDG4789471.1 M12 family metallo-peptidase [Micromonospora sp. WMMD1102]
MTTLSLPAATRGRAAPRRRLVILAVAALAAGLLPVLVDPTPASSAPDRSGNPWTRLADGSTAARSAGPVDIQAERFTGYALDRASLAATLDRAPEERAGVAPDRSLVVVLPAPDGTFQRFALVDSPVMAPGLAARHPEIRTYTGRGLDDPSATVRADLTPLGFHASVRSEHGVWYVDPYSRSDQGRYASYFVRDTTNPDEAFVEREDVAHAAGELADDIDAAPEPAGGDVTLRTYRLALVTDPSYATYFGAANVTAAKVTLVNRVTQIYEDETAIRLVLVDQTEKTNLNTPAEAIGADGPCGAAPCYTAAQLSSCASGTLNRNNIVLGQLVGASNYDVGHIGLGVNGGGIAGLGVVGGANKARGCTGLPTPVGDFFAVDYVSHEIGHQFAGNHTFNGTQWNCSGGNRSPANSYEPGSGSSIMAYAGICQQDNLQPHSDPYWSQRSYTEITSYITANRPAVNEVQNVSLRGFDTDGDSFTLTFGGAESAPIVRGGNYTAAGIRAAIEGIPGWPAGATVTVGPFGGTSTLDDTGFQVTFSGGPVAAVNVGALAVSGTSGADGFVGETVKGGPIDNGGWRVEQTGNSAPVVTAPASYTIPVRTPFALTGSATDADGDTVTYLWEQNDRGGVSGGSTAGTALVSNTKTNGPLFRQFGTAAIVSPTDTLEYHSPGLNAVGTDPTRVFPDLAQVVAGNTNAKTGGCPAAPPPPTSGGASNVPPELVDCYSEFLPTADWVGFTGDRTMHFRLTARDGHPGAGGIGSADTALTLAPAAGPFLVTSQATAETLTGGAELPVSWDVAGTDAAPVGVGEVRISLSVDGGKTFGYVLAERTANDGAETVTLPNVGAKAARIRVEAVGNVFFDLNDADLALRAAPKVTLDGPGEVLTVQYSDPLLPEVRITATDPDGGPGQLTATATGLPAGLSLGGRTPEDPDATGAAAVWGVVGNNRATPGDYPVTVTVTDQHGLAGTVAFTVRVVPEAAELAYTGDTLASTGSGGHAEVLLQATLRETSPSSGAEPWPGDVSTATVTFAAGGRTLCTDVPAPLGTDDFAAVSSCRATLPAGNSELTVTLGGNYAGSTTARVEVARPGTTVVLGGGTLTPSRSAGAYPVQPKSAVDFSVLVAQTRLGGTGTTTVGFRSDGRRYEIRGVGLDSFGVRSGGGTDRLDLRTRAGLYDVTDPRRPVTVASGLSLRITGTDRGLLSGRDGIAVTLIDGDRLLLSTDWTGLTTQETTLTNGTLLIL